MLVEICCNSLASARNAQKGGADRIELCRDLEVGGLTPAMADVEYCVHQLGIRTHVLVRPRAGDFCYDADELGQIRADIAACHEAGASAVVIGFLTPDRRIDTRLTVEMVRLAAPMEVTFHRAFDEMSQEPTEALEDIIRCGCTRVLTSGCRPTVTEGADTLRMLCRQAAGRIIILAGGGVTPCNARDVIDGTGVTEIHGSCKRILPDGTIETDTDNVRQLIKNIQR